MRLHITKSRTSTRAIRKSVAAHQDKAAALGKAAGWRSVDVSKVTLRGVSYPATRAAYPDPDKNSLADVNKKLFTPGKGHAELPRYATWSELKDMDSMKWEHGSAAKIEPNVVDRHKPTEDF